MMGVCAFALACAAFAALCLAMPKHYRALGRGEPPPRLGAALRALACACLALALAATCRQWNAPIGFVAWCGLLSVAALSVAFLATYAPRVVAAFALLALPAAAGTLTALLRGT